MAKINVNVGNKFAEKILIAGTITNYKTAKNYAHQRKVITIVLRFHLNLLIMRFGTKKEVFVYHNAMII